MAGAPYAFANPNTVACRPAPAFAPGSDEDKVMVRHTGKRYHAPNPTTTGYPIANQANPVRTLLNLPPPPNNNGYVESTHSAIQNTVPEIKDGVTTPVTTSGATPPFDLVAPSTRRTTAGTAMPTTGSTSTLTRRGGSGLDEEAKNVAWQYGCCSSLHTVLTDISRTQTSTTTDQPTIRRRRAGVGAVEAYGKSTMRSSQNVNELEKRAVVWRRMRMAEMEGRVGIGMVGVAAGVIKAKDEARLEKTRIQSVTWVPPVVMKGVAV
ncbi:hypothetical protein APHAL10511_003374 [Amanita phalloides]|nr:hypothetical protein APHAL10511_003374 [Amanita phalloides]